MKPLDERLLFADLEALGAIGATSGGGVSRPAYSNADLAARSWLEEQMRDVGMTVRRDGIGNSIGTYPGQESGSPADVVDGSRENKQEVIHGERRS
jgi:N-carbamoyl-L-amino-acid hydrolase